MLLPVVLVLLGVGLAGVLWLWPLGREFSFSQHAAQNRSATLYYAALTSAANRNPSELWLFSLSPLLPRISLAGR